MNEQTVDVKSLLDSYEFPVTLPGSGEKLLIKPITTGQMKKILVYEDESDPMVIENALDKLITGSVLTEGFNVDNLYLEDRFYLLVELRKVTKGSSYTFNIKCKKCKAESIISIDLEKLNVTNPDVKNSIIKINDRLEFEMDFPTRGTQRLSYEHAKKKGYSNNTEIIADAMTATFALSVKKVYNNGNDLGDVPFEDKIYVLDNVTNEVFDRLKNWFSENSFGVEFKSDVICTHCGEKYKIDIPLNDFFV